MNSEIKVYKLNTNTRILPFLEKEEKDISILKKGIWIYILLLIFEGALRKWVLPQLSSPLLIIRDPVAIWLLIKAGNSKINYSNQYIIVVVVVTILSFLTTLIFGHGNIWVAIYGARITLIHFPLIFLIGKVFDKSDVLQLGKFLVLLSIPMAILIIVQFYSPQSSFVNRGIGGNVEGAGFGQVNGFFRPPGTFSFTLGNTSFFSFVAPFVLYFLFYSNIISKNIVYVSLIALLIAIPFSISRSLFFSVTISFIFLVISFWNQSKRFGQIVIGIVVSVLLLYFITELGFLSDSFGVFETRFTTANESEGGIQGVFIDRALGGLISGIQDAFTGNIPFFGVGIGKGTNVGAQLLVGDNTIFLVSEVEWGRNIGEMGLIFGLSFIIVRTLFCFDLVKFSVQKLSNKDPLPWLLLSYSFISVLQGQWGTPTGLGFGIVSGGILLSALNEKI